MAGGREYSGNVKKTVEIGQKWLDRIRDADKREEKWRKQAARAEAIYLNRTEAGAHKFYFNICHCFSTPILSKNNDRFISLCINMSIR